MSFKIGFRERIYEYRPREAESYLIKAKAESSFNNLYTLSIEYLEKFNICQRDVVRNVNRPVGFNM